MKKLVLCTALVAVTVMTAASCSRRGSATDSVIEDDDILAPLPAPIETPMAQPILQEPTPVAFPLPQPQPQVVAEPVLSPLPAPNTRDCDRVPTSKSGLIMFRQNCL